MAQDDLTKNNLDDNQWHVDVMSSIAKAVSDTPLVLKGGTALLLAYGLDRHSEDLDFDSTKKINLENRIRQAVKAPVKIRSIDTPKNTDTTTRYRVVYDTPISQGNRLKIEVSYRNQELQPSHLVNGIKVYQLPVLADQKVEALKGRTQARDVYDVHFILRNYPDLLSDHQQKELARLFRGSELKERFEQAFEMDTILSAYDLDDICHNMRERLESREQTFSIPGYELDQESKQKLQDYVEKQTEVGRLFNQKMQHLSENPEVAREYSKEAVECNREAGEIAEKIVADRGFTNASLSEDITIKQRRGFEQISERMKSNQLKREDLVAVLKHARGQVMQNRQNLTEGRSRKR